MQPAPPKARAVLKPLQYCEFRKKDARTDEVDVCAVFACEELEGMVWCDMHVEIVRHALGQEA